MGAPFAPTPLVIVLCAASTCLSFAYLRCRLSPAGLSAFVYHVRPSEEVQGERGRAGECVSSVGHAAKQLWIRGPGRGISCLRQGAYAGCPRRL